ncbi:5-dehydro-4-deoxy-D-glucuronate isomerase [Phreatobacter cathodiphilus]|uniref:4-deoxy-L-threo-5-hexosulose-uronate ketol-isomerase n=1 Tax=Phreatobacter cathodiphilus TaxID=1868589 RepID=A0A2S0NDM9_9HYPH|nr:5-dehydro-4-deoxy-D-glucuronate isomerase [Phreatobacter cathodiphilus]AVO46258.1 5-dehydro-4-deoxy-D-glucuronate isomerase [Phreatobacter cathodiphilus]
MSLAVRQASHPEAARHYDTAALRAHFLVETLFRPDAVELTYSHVDRIVVGGAMPVAGPLALETHKALGQATFLARRELGVCNVGGRGRVVCDGEAFDLAPRDMLYVAMGTGDVRFESADAAEPAKFYLFSTPAHARHRTVLVREADANALELGGQEQANTRTLRQYIIPGRVESCQLVMGLTTLKPGNVWNTMPSHVHDRRCEAYLYFGLGTDARVVHLMGEPEETRHLVVANEQAIISPPWSIHSGCGTSAYSFIWAMGGDNQDFTDMDMVPMGVLR